jgi:hypothetical protein
MPSYPDVPGNRLAYDLDGSVGVQSLNGVLTTVTNTLVQNINDEADTTWPAFPSVPSGVHDFGLVFPTLRTIVGIMLMGQADHANIHDPSIQTSPDTTNLQDGTWTTRINPYPISDIFPGPIPTVAREWRSNILSVTWTNVKGIRVRVQSDGSNSNFGIRGLHLYGFDQAPSFLQIWDPLLNQQVDGNHFNWGDIPQSSNDVRTFRVHNFGALTATNVILAFNEINPQVPDQASWHYLSLDGVNYFSSVNIGSLGPGFTSGIIYVQRITPNNAQLALGAMRLVASATFV